MVDFPSLSPRLGDHMGLAEKRRRMLRLHWVEMEILELLASWSETMVSIPVRAGVGRFMWEQALHCDRLAWALRNLKHLGRVTPSVAPSDELVRYCEQLHQTEDPALRLVGLFQVLIPAVAAAEDSYLLATDPLADGNSAEAVEYCRRGHQVQTLWAESMLGVLLPTPPDRRRAADFAHAQRLALIAAGGLAADGAPAYYLPYHGWPEASEVAATRAEVPTSVGQWQTTGYRYRKGFERNVVRLRWDSRFRYADSPADLAHAPERGTVEGLTHWLHGLFHGECQTVDRMGWLLVDFPDLPWAMRKDMAQQAWEEARHIQIGAQLIEGLGGRLGQYPFPPYFQHLRRDHHHPVMHMVMGNIMGEGSAAAATNEALKYSAGWGNDWLQHGLEHLSGDEVLHVNFGKRWGRELSLADPAHFWEAGKRQAHDAVSSIETARQDFGYTVDPQRQCERVDREFEALLRAGAAMVSTEAVASGEY